MVNKDYYYKT